MTWIPPKSPYNLIQEQLYHDPWKIFVACIFCNLTRRVDAEPYLWKFFKMYSGPEAAASASLIEVQEMIQPLGLSKRRANALIQMSEGYLKKNWREDPKVLYGIGKYASDAYQIFCVGDWRGVEPKDSALNNYRNFLRETFDEN